MTWPASSTRPPSSSSGGVERGHPRSASTCELRQPAPQPSIRAPAAALGPGTPIGSGHRARALRRGTARRSPADADAKATHARALEFVAKHELAVRTAETQASSRAGTKGRRRCRPSREDRSECWMARGGELVSPRSAWSGWVHCSLQPNGGQSSTPTDERRPAPEGARLRKSVRAWFAGRTDGACVKPSLRRHPRPPLPGSIGPPVKSLPNKRGHRADLPPVGQVSPR